MSATVEHAGYFYEDGSEATADVESREKVVARSFRFYLLAQELELKNPHDPYRAYQTAFWLDVYELAYSEFWAWLGELRVSSCHVTRHADGASGEAHFTPMA